MFLKIGRRNLTVTGSIGVGVVVMRTTVLVVMSPAVIEPTSMILIMAPSVVVIIHITSSSLVLVSVFDVHHGLFLSVIHRLQCR